MNVKPKFVYYDIRRMNPVNLISYTHENDVDTQVLEVSMLDNGEPIELDTNYTYSAAIVNRDTQALIDDSVSCTLNDSGNVLIPIDNFHTLGAQDLLIELTITDSAGNQVLVTPFPLWIHVNASILDDAQVTPESQGTVPELLEEAKEALENAGDYESIENKPQINGHELVGNKSSDDLGLQNKLTAGENITINANGEISANGGVTSYPQLSDLPRLIYNYGTSPSQQHQMYTIYAIDIYDSGGFVVTDVGGTGNRPSIALAKNVFRSDYTKVVNDYNFNVLRINGVKNGVNASFRVQLSNATNVPAEFSILTDVIYITHYWSPATSGTGQLIRHVTGQDANGKIHYFVNIAEGTYNINSLTVTSSAWKELTSTISSATVNQNGTITFTMSDDSTVTTTGQSVIGPQGPQGIQGATGPQGIQGEKGDKGDKGDTGAAGAQGEQGVKGDPGATGADGFSPTATITQTQSGATVTITDKNGTTTANLSNGAPGQDYVLTTQDKDDIANIVLAEFTGSIVNGELNTR